MAVFGRILGVAPMWNAHILSSRLHGKARLHGGDALKFNYWPLHPAFPQPPVQASPRGRQDYSPVESLRPVQSAFSILENPITELPRQSQ